MKDMHSHDVVAASQNEATRMSTWRANYPNAKKSSHGTDKKNDCML